MKVKTLKDSQGKVYDVALELPEAELEKRHQTRVVEITVKMPNGKFARAFVHAATGRNGVQFELTCFKKTGETSVRAIANYREPRPTILPKPIPATQENIDRVLLRNAEIDNEHALLDNEED